jgi:hypothetical protein
MPGSITAQWLEGGAAALAGDRSHAAISNARDLGVRQEIMRWQEAGISEERTP